MSALRLVATVLTVLALPSLAAAQGMGVTPDGKKGRIHVVKRGDTLWDITATYLGTPWIWPSIWRENEDIENPHLIHPGDLIWIAEGEMRRLTPEEAEALMSGQPPVPTDEAPEMDPNARADVPIIPAAPVVEEEDATPYEDPFAALDQGDTGVERQLEWPGLHRYGFITDTELHGAGAIMGSHAPNYWVSQEQRTIVSLGEGESHVGDDVTVFRTRRRVLHPETREVLGYFIEILGRAEVTEIHPESSFVRIVAAYSEIQPGDRVKPYEEPPDAIVEVHSDESVEGFVLGHQPNRLRSGAGDFVLLDGGTRDGITPGRRFELFRPGREVRDPATLVQVLVPDDIIGGALVIKSSEKTSLALITRARTEVLSGDRFRSAR